MAIDFSNWIGVIGAAMDGAMAGSRMREQDDDAKKERAQMAKLRDLQIADAQQKQDNQQALKDAGADVQPQTNTPELNNPVDGMGPSAMMVGKQAFSPDSSASVNAPGDGMGPSASMVNGQAVAQAVDSATARAYADSQNTPQAKMARQRAVLDTQVDPMGAQGRQSADLRQQADQLSLSGAQRKHVDQLFDDALGNVSSHKSIADLVSASPHDGQGGALKVMAVPSKDGKTVQYRQIMEDGTVSPQGPQFSNDADGVLAAKGFLSRSMSINDKLMHLHQQHQEATAQKNADSEAMLRNAQANYYSGKNDTASMRAVSARRADHFDEKEWDAANKVEPSFVAFDDGMGGKPVESPELRLTFQSELNAARQAGSMSPNEAAEQARTTTLKLKNAASDRVAAARQTDPKSTLTEAQAVRQILSEYRASQKAKPAHAPSPQAAAANRPQAQMVAPRPPASTQSGDKALNAIQAEHIAVLGGLKQQVDTAQAQLAAAAKSGDPKAMQTYATALQKARDTLIAEATRRLGNGAQTYLAH